MRTNIDIDDRLMRQAMRSSGARTKRAAVEEGLRLLIRTVGGEAWGVLWGQGSDSGRSVDLPPLMFPIVFAGGLDVKARLLALEARDSSPPTSGRIARARVP